MDLILVGLQQNVGKNWKRSAGADYILDLLQAFEQFFFRNAKFHDEQKRLRCKAFDFVRQAAISLCDSTGIADEHALEAHTSSSLQ
jgi:hypothetical protein